MVMVVKVIMVVMVVMLVILICLMWAWTGQIGQTKATFKSCVGQLSQFLWCFFYSLGSNNEKWKSGKKEQYSFWTCFESFVTWNKLFLLAGEAKQVHSSSPAWPHRQTCQTNHTLCSPGFYLTINNQNLFLGGDILRQKCFLHSFSIWSEMGPDVMYPGLVQLIK